MIANEKIDTLLEKLDIKEHAKKLQKYFAREKSIILRGDSNIHAKFIKELEEFELPPLPEVINLDDALMRLSKEATLDIATIFEFVKIVGFFNRLKAKIVPPLWSEFIKNIEIPKEILEITTLFNEKGELDSQKIEELSEIESALTHLKSEKKEHLRRILNQSKLQEFLVDSQVHLYYGQEALLVRGGFSRVLPAQILGRSSSGYFYVLPDSLHSLSQKESTLLDKKQEIIQKYAKIFSKTFTKWLKFLQFLNSAFDRVDQYSARVLLMKKQDLQLFLNKKHKKVILKEFKHPALNNPKPIDIAFENKIMLITGVNAGGKTMLLKSILAAVLMSKYLIPFSANIQSEIGSFEIVEAILDDPQSVKNDISTFAGRMLSFKRLFNLKDALVGVDEIELGTDADEAAALFRTLLEELSKKGIYFIVTTHHKRLASLMAKNRDVTLIAALYDEKNQEPTYTYLSGSIGKSYAFETALRYGISPSLIQKAKENLGQDKERLNELIEKSTQLEITMRQKMEEATKALEEANEEKAKLKSLKEALQKEYQQKLFELEKKYNKSLALLKEAIKNANESKKAHQLLNKAHKSKSSIKMPQKEELLKEIKENQKVLYRGKEAIVLSVRNKDVFIEVQGLKLKVKKSDLTPYKEVKKVKTPPKVVLNVQKSNKASLTLKLLGKRADEAQELMHEFISDALMHGFSEVEIIHGIGSGVLAKVVHEFLKRHPRVKGFERAKGNSGVTIVKL